MTKFNISEHPGIQHNHSYRSGAISDTELNLIDDQELKNFKFVGPEDQNEKPRRSPSSGLAKTRYAPGGPEPRPIR